MANEIIGFKAAERKVPMFISKVHRDTKVCDIEKHIQGKANIPISLQKINTAKRKDYDAYKFFVPQDKIPFLLDENIWPQGIIFRRFVHYKRNIVDKSENGRTKGNSG